MTLVLASSSPRRLDLLRRAGLDPLVDPAGIDESRPAGESVTDHVVRLAVTKCATVVARHPGADVLAADTVVDLDGEVLGQPADDAAARHTLRLLSGRTHLVHTAVAASIAGESRTCLVTSRVAFRRLTDARVDWYVATGESRGKAGAYAVQGLGVTLVASVRGSLTNVVGLPMPEALALLR